MQFKELRIMRQYLQNVGLEKIDGLFKLKEDRWKLSKDVERKGEKQDNGFRGGIKGRFI